MKIKKPFCLESLLATASSDHLCLFVQQFSPSYRTIQILKDYTAQFHSSKPIYAVQVAQRTYELSQLLPDPAEALGAWCLGNAYLHNSQYIEAAYYLSKARSRYLVRGELLEAARLSVSLVGAMAYAGQPRKALALAAEVEPILADSAQTDASDKGRWGGLMINSGFICEMLGEYEESIALYKRCIDRLAGMEQTHRVARATHNLAYALVQIGSLKEAQEKYAEAERLFEEVKSDSDLLRLRINRCHLLISFGNVDSAIVQAAELHEIVSQTEEMSQARRRLAILQAQLSLMKKQTIEQAVLDDLHLAQEAFTVYGPVLEEGITWLLLGRCYLAQSRSENARECYQKALALMTKGADRTIAFWGKHGLAQCAKFEGHVERAIEFYNAALEQLELVRNDLQVETLRSAYLTNKVEVYQDFAELLIHIDKIEDAFQIIERAKAQTITEKLRSRLLQEVQQAATSENIVVGRLAQELQSALHDLESAYETIHFQSEDTKDKTKSVNAIHKQEHVVHELIAEIQRRQAIFSNLTIGESVSLATLQQNLQGIDFLQYHTIGGRFSVFVVTDHGGIAHYELGYISDVIAAIRGFITSSQRVLGLIEQAGPERLVRRLHQQLQASNQYLSQLYTMLIQPIEQFLSPHGKLVIAPHEILHEVPFHALYKGESYLLEERIISYTPNATVFDTSISRRQAGHKALLLGYDDAQLDAINAEMQMVARYFPASIMCTGTDATTEYFLANAPGANLIHIAAHASFRRNRPMLSSIALSDRRLTLAEISRLHLRADLATLSGCETAAGQLTGTDVLSLATGFLGAGVRSLLVSMWRVEDSTTARLMDSFYGAVQGGHSYAEALCTAQRALLTLGRQSEDEQKAFQHPAFWAPFVLHGGR